ncbi:MAG: transposase [Firmicutes bacterium]|nr:transposase [Bacillota bacterium]
MLLCHDQAYATEGPDVKGSRGRRRQVARRHGLDLKSRRRQDLARICRDGMEAFCLDVGLGAFAEAMQAEVEEICGPRGRRMGKGERRYARYGTAPGSIVIGARKVAIQRPRVRELGEHGGEVRLEFYEAARGEGFLEAAVVGALSRGVSQRGYGEVARAVAPAGREVMGLSASSAGRRFIEATRRAAEAYQKRPIEGEFLALFMDGVAFGGYVIVVAVGIRDDGTKMVLGVRQGDTENRALCQEMLESMVARGLGWQGRRMLVVTDGGKGIQAAAKAVFGKALVLQRCRSHRGRNITDKLPEGEREGVRRQLWRAWMTEDAEQAKARLEGLARRLELKGHRDAAASVRDDLEDTIALNRLGVSPNLARLLGTTNVIESPFALCKDLTRGRVKRWRHSEQAERWAILGLAKAEASFGRFATAHDLAALAKALAMPAESHTRPRAPAA